MMMYKYVTEDRVDILEKGMIRFTQSAALNDPFETNPVSGEFKRSLAKFVRTKNDQLLRQLSGAERYSAISQLPLLAKRYYEELVDKLRHKQGMLCLSENRNELLMWSHYSNSHKGFVIGFDANHAFFKTHKVNQQAPLTKVKYLESRPILPQYEYLLARSENLAEVYLFTKSKHWEYEQEWRMLYNVAYATQKIHVSGGLHIYLFEFPPDCIKEVVLGCQMPKATQQKLSAIIKDRYPLVQVYKAKMSATRFGLDIRAYS